MKVSHFIFDTLLKDVQHFYYTTNAVINIGLTCVITEQKVNIAVATCLKQVKENQTYYQHRDLNLGKLHIFKACLVLKNTNKLA